MRTGIFQQRPASPCQALQTRQHTFVPTAHKGRCIPRACHSVRRNENMPTPRRCRHATRPQRTSVLWAYQYPWKLVIPAPVGFPVARLHFPEAFRAEPQSGHPSYPERRHAQANKQTIRLSAFHCDSSASRNSFRLEGRVVRQQRQFVDHAVGRPAKSRWQPTGQCLQVSGQINASDDQSAPEHCLRGLDRRWRPHVAVIARQHAVQQLTGINLREVGQCAHAAKSIIGDLTTPASNKAS